MTEAEPSLPADPTLYQEWAPGAFELLLKEYDTLKELYLHAESGAQGLFNFYLTLLTALVGGMTLLLQFQSVEATDRTMTAAGLLLFTAALGSVYLSALSGRYAHMARYARALDELRRYLLLDCPVRLPALYEPFLAEATASPAKVSRFHEWFPRLFPTGSYTFFVAGMNSAALAAATWLFLAAAGDGSAPGASITATLLVFVVTFTICNLYSHLVLRALVTRLNICVSTHEALPYVVGRQ